MPPVKSAKGKAGKGAKPAAPPVPTPEERQRRAASYLTGLTIIAAMTIGVAAWLGGEMSSVKRAMDRQVQSAMAGMGLTVEDVFIEGVEGDLARQVRARAMVEPGESMLSADPHVIRDRVLGLEFIREARVYRYWPDQVFISVSLRTPVAVWRGPDGTAVVDASGALMPSAKHERAPQMPRLTGLGAPQAALPFVAALKDHPEVAGRLRYAERIGARRWDVHLISGAVLSLPEDASLKRGLEAASRLAQTSELLDASALRLDLRQPNSLFTRPIDPSPLDGSASG